MSATDHLDALLAALLPAPAKEPEAQAAPKPVLSPERASNLRRLDEWLAKNLPHDYAGRDPNWQPEPYPGYQVAKPESPEPFDAEIAAEMVVAHAWLDGDHAGFASALSRLPPDRAEHHRRMAAVCDLIKSRQDVWAPAPAQGGTS